MWASRVDVGGSEEECCVGIVGASKARIMRADFGAE